MNVMNKIDQALNRIIFVFMNILVYTMSIVIVLQVVCRLAGFPLTWTEEVARLLMIWLIFMGAAYLYNMPQNGHIVVDALLQVLPGKVVGIITQFIRAIVAVFIVAAIYYGSILMLQSTTVVLTATKISINYEYASIPVSMLCMLFFTVHQFLERRQVARRTVRD